MKFETIYKNITFEIILEKEIIENLEAHLGDRFYRLPNQTLAELKKGNIIYYNIIISSHREQTSFTHYFPNVLLSKKESELLDDLEEYLKSEKLLDDVVDYWELSQNENGPKWK